MKSVKTPLHFAVLVVMALLFLSPGLSMAQQPWTTVGSAGTVDEDDLSSVELADGEVTTTRGTREATINIRYNIVAVADLVGPTQFRLAARFLDTGPDTQVLLHLKSYNLQTGVTTTIATFDSNDFRGGSYQTRGICVFPNFDFETDGYFIDAELIDTKVVSRPGLGMIQISSAINCTG